MHVPCQGPWLSVYGEHTFALDLFIAYGNEL